MLLAARPNAVNKINFSPGKQATAPETDREREKLKKQTKRSKKYDF